MASSKNRKKSQADVDRETDGLFSSRKVQVNISQSRLSSCFAKPKPDSKSETPKVQVPPGFSSSKNSPAVGTSEDGHFSCSSSRGLDTGLKTRLTDAEKEESRRLKKCYTCGEAGHPYFRCPQEEKRLNVIKAEKESRSSGKLWRDLSWVYKAANGQMQGPFSLLRLCGKLQDGALSGYIEVSHVHAKVGPIALGKLMEHADNGTLVMLLNNSEVDGKLRDKLMDVVQRKLHSEVLETTVRLIFNTVVDENLQAWINSKKPCRRPTTDEQPSQYPDQYLSQAAQATSTWVEAPSESYPEPYGPEPYGPEPYSFQVPAFEVEPPPPGCEDASTPSASGRAASTSGPVSLKPHSSISREASGGREASSLQTVQERLHHAVVEAARKGILDAVVGQYLQSWISNNEMRKRAAEAEEAKARLENEKQIPADMDIFQSGMEAEPVQDPDISTPKRRTPKDEALEKIVKRKRKPVEVKQEDPPKKKIARKRLVKVAEDDPESSPLPESPKPQNDINKDSPSDEKMAEETKPEISKSPKRKPKDENDAPVKKRSRKRPVGFVETEEKEVTLQAQVTSDGNKSSSSRGLDKRQRAESEAQTPAKKATGGRKRKDVQVPKKKTDCRSKQVRRRQTKEKLETKKYVDEEHGSRNVACPPPDSKGCSRCYVDGWEWREWSRTAKRLPRTEVEIQEPKLRAARSNRAQFRNLAAEVPKVSQKARKKNLKFQRSQIHAWGIMAGERIEAEDYVTEYVGEVVRAKVADLREARYEKSGLDSSYFFRIDGEYVVDATKCGGIARFINHSCDPNCYPKILTVGGQKRIFIYSKTVISPGEELTYDYKFPLEEKKVPCFCGAAKCRKYMN